MNNPVPSKMKNSPYANKLIAASALVGGVSSATEKIRAWKNTYDEKRRYSATVSENSYVYRPLMGWLNSQVQGRKFVFQTNPYNLNKGVLRYYDDNGISRVTIEGHTLSVNFVKPNLTDAVSPSMEITRDAMQKKLKFSSKDPAAIDAFERLLNQLIHNELNKSRSVMVHTIAGTGYWDDNDLADKSIESVFLPEGVREHLCSDLEDFLSQKELYETVGIPWHRGYLLHGEPGNGKSSLAAALAHHYSMHIYNMPLSSVKDDQKLAELVSDVEPKSILLIEDIDIFSDSMERKQNDKGVTLAGLLNCLDGVSTPSGLVTFITTNNKENLDPALIRPGRVDYDLELKPPVAYQIESMYQKVYGDSLGGTPRQFKSMAEVANVFKTNLRHPDKVRLNLIENP